MAETDKSGAERWTDGLKATGEKLRSAGERLNENTRAVNLRVIEQAEENAREAFRALRDAAQAGSLKDVAEIQARYLREQGKRGADQMREIGELIARFGREAVAPAKSEGKPSGKAGKSAAAKKEAPPEGPAEA